MKFSPVRILRWLVVGLVIGVAGVELVTAAGVYALGWHGPKTTAWTRWVPVPVASVGWHLVAAHTWLEQYQAIATYNTQLTSASPSSFPAKSADQNAELAMTKAVRDVGLLRLLDTYRLTVSSSDVEQAYQAQLTQTGQPEQIAQTIRRLYNWSPEEFKQNVIRTVVAQDKLQSKLSFDDSLNTTSRQQADRVLALVKAGQQSFEDLAKAYSDDAYGAQGGDLGFVPRGSQDKVIEDAAFSLPIDSVSGLLHTKFGFHIIKVVERKTVDGQDQAHLKQIFIAAPSVDQFLTTAMAKQRVWVWLPRIAWDATHGQATAKH